MLSYRVLIRALVLATSVVCSGSLALAETITVPPCGNTPGTTAGSYSGLVQMTVSGLLLNTPGNPLQDAFYGVDPNDTSMPVGPCQGCFRYNRVSEGSCLCSFECAATSHPIESILAQPLPAFEPSHVYSVVLDLGNGPVEALHFGMADCGCSDNSGEYTVTVEPVAMTTTTEPEVTPTTSTTTTTATSTTTTTAACVPPDEDADGEADATDRCPNTPIDTEVDGNGCALSQFCGGFDASTSDGAKSCKRADWKNDEPSMKAKEADCVVDKGGRGHEDDRCVPAPE